MADASARNRRTGHRWVPLLLRLYRLGVLVAIFLLIREHHTRLKIAGDRPITLAEVKAFLPEAYRLAADDGVRQGYAVYRENGEQLGYVVRTAPQSNAIVGYSGPTDTLVVFDAEERIQGLHLRHSYDTPNHIEDVVNDYLFMESWNGKTWKDVAAMDLEAAGVEGVSGATRTSMCLAEGLVYRLSLAFSAAPAPPPLRFKLNDIMLVLTLLVGMAFTFNWYPQKRAAESALLTRKRLRRIFQLFVIGYIGFVQGDLIAQSLLRGWAESGIPWRYTPGLVLMVAAALIIPWGTRKPLYCSQICPHGAAQEILGKVLPKKIKPRLAPGLKKGLQAIPVLLLTLVVLTIMLALPLDLAGIEPFDAYIFRAAGIATISVAVVGLVGALFVPMGYCHYGCPTGSLLRFVRSHGSADHVRAGDVVAGLLLVLTWGLFCNYNEIMEWVLRTPLI